MVVVEPLVSEEKLLQLLAEQAESAELDFMSTCDLRRKADQVELAKDVGAMQMHGGYVVVGANDRGQPVAELDDNQIHLFDEARRRAKLRKWLAEPLSLLSAAHMVAGRALMLSTNVCGDQPQRLDPLSAYWLRQAGASNGLAK